MALQIWQIIWFCNTLVPTRWAESYNDTSHKKVRPKENGSLLRADFFMRLSECVYCITTLRVITLPVAVVARMM